jgi:hypothetical protein
MSLLLLFHPKVADAGGTFATGDVSADGVATATLSGASIASASISADGAGDLTFGGAALANSEAFMEGAAAATASTSSLASADVSGEGVGNLTLEADSPATFESGAFSMEAEATLVMDGASTAEAAAQADGAADLVMVGYDGEEEETRKTWGAIAAQMRRRRRKVVPLEPVAVRKLEIEDDDEEVFALVRRAAAELLSARA